MKVCFFSHAANKGGAERSLLETVKVLKDRGVDCHVVLPRSGPLEIDLKAFGISYTRWPFRWWAEQRSLPLRARLRQLLEILASLLLTPILAIRIRRLMPDVVYTNSIVSPVGAVVAYILGLPHVWHIREFGKEDHDLDFFLGERLTHKIVQRLSAACLTNSNAVAAKYAGSIDPSLLHVVYQAVIVPGESARVAERSVSRQSVLTCVIVGTLTIGKGQDMAIEAVARLRRSGKNVRLRIVGMGRQDYREYLEGLIEQSGVRDAVSFCGYIDNPHEIISSADVLLMCSRSEAFGRVTIEAMKLGVPVVGARSGGTTELIKDGINGYLFDASNIEDLVEKLERLYENRADLDDMSHKARAWAVDTFNEERHGQRIVEILSHIAFEHRKSSRVVS